MNYIAVDTHISTLDFAVVNERGKLVDEKRVRTGVKDFMKYVKGISHPRQIIIEEGTLSSWLLEICNKFGERLIITDPKINRWI